MTIFKLATTLFSIGQSLRKYSDITSTQCGVAPISSTTVEKLKYEELLQWMRSNNAEISDKLFIQESTFGVGYGAFVSAQVEEGDILFTVPREACVTLADALKDPKCGETFSKVMEKAGPGGNTVVMAAYLAKEYLISFEQDVKFGPYLETLPWERGINSQEHILFWSDDDIDNNLRGSFCYAEAKELRSEVTLASKIINTIIGDSVRSARGEMDDGFKWPWQITPKETAGKPIDGLDQAVRGAFVSLLTRAFQDGDGDEEKLVPMLDVLQHSEQPNVRHAMRKDDGTVEVRARRTIAAGEELLNQYRSEEDENMPYHRFFTRFGFVPGIMEPVENLLGDKSSIFYPKVVEV
jgi:SET domain